MDVADENVAAASPRVERRIPSAAAPPTIGSPTTPPAPSLTRRTICPAHRDATACLPQIIAEDVSDGHVSRMVQIQGDDIDEASARGVIGLLIGASTGLITWISAYWLFMSVLGS